MLTACLVIILPFIILLNLSAFEDLFFVCT